MDAIISIILLVLILCIIIFLHEFGHFITAKKAGVYIYEFSLGFGPKIKSFKRKNDETMYSLRAIPLGGYVSMAGEHSGTEDNKIRKDQRLSEKSFGWRLTVLLAGVFMNFLLAIVILFACGLIYGSPETKPIIGNVVENGPADKAGLVVDDTITKINGKKVNTLEDLSLEVLTLENKENITFTVLSKDNITSNLTISAQMEKVDEETLYHYGFSTSTKRYFGFSESIKYTVNKFDSMISSMGKIIAYLFNGKVSVKELSGPIGIYTIVDSSKAGGVENILYLVAFLSVNVGFINLIPIPVFDGGRALLLIIEKVSRKKINPKVESALDTIGFFLLILLMVYVTFNDIFKLF